MPALLPMAAAKRSPRASWQLRVNAMVLFWFVAALIVGVLRSRLLYPNWLLVHMLLLGGAMTAILIWSEHFADALLHLPPVNRSESLARLILFQVGVVALIAGFAFAEPNPLLVIFGGLVAVSVVAWHGTLLAMRARAGRTGRLALAGRHGYVIRYYVSAAAWFCVAGLVGIVLGTGSVSEPWDGRFHLAHVESMLFGVMLMTIIGTLFTLWPTMLRSFMPDDTRRGANVSLVLLNAGIAVTDLGDVVASKWVALAGLVVMVVGVGRATVVFGRAVKRPRLWTGPTTATAAAAVWLIGVVVANCYLLLHIGKFEDVADAAAVLVLPFAIGFTGQVLIASLTYLLPVVAGGGPTAVRDAIATINFGWIARLAAFNVGLLLLVLPTGLLPEIVGRLGGAAVVVTVVTFIGLAVRIMTRRPSPRGGIRPIDQISRGG
jgi:nitrite reductase (NO-forming)